MKKELVYMAVCGLMIGLLAGCKTNRKVAANTEKQTEPVEQTVAAQEPDDATEGKERVSRPPRPQRVPAYRGVIPRTQPDGTILHIYLRGDEWSHFSMTTDGYEVREDAAGRICYMQKAEGGDGQQATVTDRQAHDRDNRTEEEQEWLEKHGVKRIVTE
ncbi:MAG: hypothetical protein J6Y00_02255 [Paludibacteraceae bacterium]|nr:hypothetical protein [Paludibacteraceae bacterium]